MDFQNEVISLDSLPDYQSAALEPIDRRYRMVIIWQWIFATLVAAGIVLLFFFVDEWIPYRWVAVGAWIALAVSWMLLSLQAFKRRAYAVRMHDIIYRHGILSISTTVIPFVRIQHVTVHEGILSRLYGLASVQVFTAGGSSADLKVNGLPRATAESLKEVILQQIKK